VAGRADRHRRCSVTGEGGWAIAVCGRVL